MNSALSAKSGILEPSVSPVGNSQLAPQEVAIAEGEDITVRVVTDEQSWFAMRDEWNNLLEDSVYPNVFLRWEWLTTWWESFKDHRSLCILLVKVDGKLLGIAPFYRTTTGIPGVTRCNRLYCIGYGGPLCAEYLGPIIRSGCIGVVCRALAAFLSARRDWDVLFLEDYAIDDPGTTAFVCSLTAKAPFVALPGEPRYFISLPASYNEYLDTLSAHSRKTKRGKFRRASRDQDAQLVQLSPETMDYWFPWITQMSVLSRARIGHVSPFLREDYASFHRQVLSRLMPGEYARVFLLILDGQPAAFWYLLRYRGKYYAYQTGCDDKRKGSPGDVSLQMVLMDVIEETAGEFDFLRGDHQYKRAYTDVTRETRAVFTFRRPAVNYAVCWFLEYFVQPAKKRLKHAFRRNAL